MSPPSALYEEARGSKTALSLATVYNTLRQFSDAGLLREIAVYGSRIWYDTNTGPHFHFYVEDRDELLDVPEDMVAVLKLPLAPAGMEILGADVIVRVKAAQLTRRSLLREQPLLSPRALPGRRGGRRSGRAGGTAGRARTRSPRA